MIHFLGEYFSAIKMEKEKEALKLQIATLKKSIEELSTMSSNSDQQDLLLYIQVRDHTYIEKI